MLPVIAIVGRPNVGKSTLFNRLVARRSALVADEPGLTRDRHYGRGEWEGRAFHLVDTGGFEIDVEREGIEALIRIQTEAAISEADLVIAVWDARQGLTTIDEELSARLRRSGKPVIHVANKVDGPRQREALGEFYALGAPRVFGISAEHGLGFDEMIDEMIERLPPAPSEPEASESTEGMIRLALVGRPNAGKSALLNRLVGQPRAIVSEMPGTTRDPVDAEIQRAGTRYRLVDTAGIRRRRKSGPQMEQISVLRALRAIEDADVVALVIDGAGGIGAQDARIANLAVTAGRGLVLVLAKSDLLQRPDRERVRQQLRDRLHFVAFAPRLFLSALSGHGVGRLLPLVRRTHRAGARRVATAELNRLLGELTAAHPPPSYRGRAIKLLYATQTGIHPPTFVISTSHPRGLDQGYRRYVRNRLREQYGFEGTPLRLLFRPRRRR